MGPEDIAKKALAAEAAGEKPAETPVSADANGIDVSTGSVSDDKRSEVKNTTRRAGFGDFTSAVSLAYHGINHRGLGNAIQNNTDNFGYTFFTRPRLNLSYDNITQDRIFTVLLGREEYSTLRAIRAFLDPVGSKQGATDTFHCPLVDDLNPFITLLTNNLLSLSGWPDPYVETYTSSEGVYKEQWSMIDGPSKYHGVYSLTANFRNIVDDPISMMFNIWTQYAARVYEGMFMPHLDAIFENEIDYQTRIYRLVMDHSRTKVQKIAACGASFPVANNLGASFNFNAEKPYNDEIDQISVAFQCTGAIYNDPILVDSFNRVSYIYNPALYPIKTNDKGVRVNAAHTKLRPDEKLLFNYFGYPQINPDTMELEWWVRNEDYDLVVGKGGDTTTNAIKKAIPGVGALATAASILR